MKRICTYLQLLSVICLSTVVSLSATAQTTSFTKSTDTICYEGIGNFYNTSTGSIDSITWVVNGNILHRDTVGVSFREPGIDTIYLYVYRGTSVDTAFDVVYVRPLQYLNTLIDSADVLVETIRPAICIWYRDDGGLVPGTIEPECEVCGQLAGCYYAIVGTVGCYFGITDTICIYPAGVNALAATTAVIQMYPNPATTSLTIKAPQEITTVTITNMIGQTVLTNNYHKDEVQVNIADLPAGMYLIKINGSEVRRFVKE